MKSNRKAIEGRSSAPCSPSSLTPETDAMVAADQHHLEDDNFFPATVYWRMCDMARTLERERDEWKAKFLQQNKDLGCELRDQNGTIWSHAATVERERNEAIKAIKSAKAYKRVLKNENARLRRMLNLPENVKVMAAPLAGATVETGVKP